jgi:cob(I)alamin adenosyltransferase
MTTSPEFQKYKESCPIHNSKMTVAELLETLENRLFEYNRKFNTANPEKYKSIHLPEIRRLSKVIDGLTEAFEELQKEPS